MPTSHTADISWQAQQPYSNQFDDVYFSTDNGLLETEYVFLAANRLPARWLESDLKAFTIIETGFGTGLNFLSAVALWQTTAPNNAKLHFISIEKYPLSAEQLTQALAAWPSLAPLSETLTKAYATIDLNSYPQTITIEPMPNIQLTLYLNDINQCIGDIKEQADAWFLDGFAPSKNPGMWNAALFSNMARLSHTHTTFSTFTCAGIVKRGLKEAGFKVNKHPGFGKKREMLIGQLNDTGAQ
jgi:tRNA 5-methylaminomethyl-2-thiouridine biosynthesis bifunctional protein